MLYQAAVCACMSMCVYVQIPEEEKRQGHTCIPISQSWELWVIMNSLVSVLGTKLWSSEKAASTLNL